MSTEEEFGHRLKRESCYVAFYVTSIGLRTRVPSEDEREDVGVDEDQVFDAECLTRLRAA